MLGVLRGPCAGVLRVGRLRGGRAGLGHVLACFRLFAYAAGGIGLPAPCTPGRGMAPGPQIDVIAWELSGAIGNEHR